MALRLILITIFHSAMRFSLSMITALVLGLPVKVNL
nr:MAG TPA: hypothetical protein [Caudoviricetes sp.]